MEIDIDIIIMHVLSGEISSDEQLQLDSWLASDSRNRLEYERIKAYWNADVKYLDAISADDSWKNLQQRLNTNEKRTKENVINMSRRKYLLIAASIAVLIIFSLTYFFVKPTTKCELFTLQTQDKRQQFVLNDGTKVTLNKNSSLTYTGNYGEKTRTVQLRGEAFFEVAKDAKHPFEVEMGDAQICVLGTVFTVKSDVNKNEIIASLLEGSIRFETPSQEKVISPDQQIIYDRLSQKTEIRPTHAIDDAEWRNGRYKYTSVPFTTLVSDLERIYQVRIEVLSDRLKRSEMLVTGTFYENQSLQDILKTINRTINIQWEEKNGYYTIR